MEKQKKSSAIKETGNDSVCSFIVESMRLPIGKCSIFKVCYFHKQTLPLGTPLILYASHDKNLLLNVQSGKLE